jgi:hypothetical protein
MSSYLDIEGKYDQNTRYTVFNWSKEDFSQQFGENSAYNDKQIIVLNHPYVITLKAGEMREFGQFEALIITKNLVSREMMREAEKEKDEKKKERIGMQMNNREARKPYEDKTISLIEPGTESLIIKNMRDEIRAEEIAKIKEEMKTKKTDKKDIKKEDKKNNDSAEFAGV